MSGETVLIASYSARALAQSARRAGYSPLVVDAFGDQDTRAAATSVRVVADAAGAGFKTKPLLAALEDLAAMAASKPIGLVLGSGFEDKTLLVSALATRFPLLGCSSETIRVCKDPDVLSATLNHLGIPHPPTQRVMAEDDRTSWLSKRVGGSGGRHIRKCGPESQPRPRRYFQKELDGARISIGGIFSSGGARLAVTRQWTSPSPSQPFRYGGAVSMPPLDAELFGQLAAAATAAANAFTIVGMASFDFIVAKRLAHLVDINPRPGAAIDVLDDEDGYAFSAHIIACQGGYVAPMPRRPTGAKAAAVLHADRGMVNVGTIAWPEWSADRPTPDSVVPHGAPLATARASADTAENAENLARARLADLETLIYEPR
ncbi:MAG: ATP-grasp domain-containing protein [Hyphomicrobium sp.]